MSRAQLGRHRASHPLATVVGVTVMTGVLLVGSALGTPSAGAATPSTPDVHADSTGPIVVDGSGNGYVAWASSKGNANGDPLHFCKIPQGGTCTHGLVLPLPTGATWDSYRVNQPFPVLGGKAGVVSVVGPSYDYGDVVVWTSHNGGTSFGEPQVISNCSYDGTGTDDVLRSPDADPPYYPDYFSIASTNPGLFYTFTGIGAIGALDPPVGFEQDTESVPGEVAQSTLGYGKTVNPGTDQTTQTVEAFSTDAAKPQLDYFWSPLPGVTGSPGSLEHGPTNVATGINPRLAGGPKGLFLLSEDYTGRTTGAAKPLHLDVRKWDPKTESFGKPSLVTQIPDDADATSEGGFTEDGSTGALTVAWPTEATGGGEVMKTWTSATGAGFSAPSIVAPVAASYQGPARVASVGGHGFVTWQDSGGLEIAALTGG